MDSVTQDVSNWRTKLNYRLSNRSDSDAWELASGLRNSRLQPAYVTIRTDSSERSSEEQHETNNKPHSRQDVLDSRLGVSKKGLLETGIDSAKTDGTQRTGPKKPTSSDSDGEGSALSTSMVSTLQRRQLLGSAGVVGSTLLAGCNLFGGGDDDTGDTESDDTDGPPGTETGESDDSESDTETETEDDSEDERTGDDESGDDGTGDEQTEGDESDDDEAGDDESEPEQLPPTIDSEESFEGNVTVPSDSTTTVGGEAGINIEGDATIDGTVDSEEDALKMNVEGDLTVNGKLSSKTSRQQDGSGETEPPESEDDVPMRDQSRGIQIIAKGDVEFAESAEVESDGYVLVDDNEALLDRTPREIEDGALTVQGTPPTLISPPPNSPNAPNDFFYETGDVGAVGRRVIVTGTWTGQGLIFRASNATDVTIDGAELNIVGPAQEQDGEDGRDGKVLVGWANNGSFNARGSTINLSPGGDGGDQTVTGCASANGGDGGQPGGFRFSGDDGVNLTNVTINPGQAGRGGDAEAIEPEEPGEGCPGEDGCDRRAIGGKGGNAHFALRAEGNVSILNASIGSVEAGRGGDSEVESQHGEKGSDPCCDGGDGGDATAEGGDGGDASLNFGQLPFDSSEIVPGDGGKAQATAGDGGEAPSGITPGGGVASGGDGGTATANPGSVGEGSGQGDVADPVVRVPRVQQGGNSAGMAFCLPPAIPICIEIAIQLIAVDFDSADMAVDTADAFAALIEDKADVVDDPGTDLGKGHLVDFFREEHPDYPSETIDSLAELFAVQLDAGEKADECWLTAAEMGEAVRDNVDAMNDASQDVTEGQAYHWLSQTGKE